MNQTPKIQNINRTKCTLKASEVLCWTQCFQSEVHSTVVSKFLKCFSYYAYCVKICSY